MSKLCEVCGQPKKLYREGRSSYCPTCAKAAYDPAVARARHLRLHYGITVEEYDRLFELQDGKCAICGRSKVVLDVDHVHGRKGLAAVRGLLCKECNRALGLLGDTYEGVFRAVDYLHPFLLKA